MFSRKQCSCDWCMCFYVLLWSQNVLEYLGLFFFSHNVFSVVISSEKAWKSHKKVSEKKNTYDEKKLS